MRLFLFSLLVLANGPVFAQQFVQEFRTNRDDAASAVQQVENQEYLMLNYRLALGIGAPGSLNLTKMSNLGRQRWSRDYDFEFPVSNGDLAYWREKGTYLVSTMAAVDTARDKIVARFDIGGSLVWARRLGAASPVQFENTGRTKVLPVSDSTFVVAAGAGGFASATGDNDLMLAKLDADGNLLWARSYCFSCLGDFETLLGDLLYTSDGGFLLSGGLYYPGPTGIRQEALLLKTDGDGQIIWLKSYAASSMAPIAPNLIAWNLAEPKPGQYAVTGAFNDAANANADGLFMTLNDTGAVYFSTRWNVVGGDFQVSTFDLAVRDTGTVVMAGSTVENTTPSVAREFNFLAAVSTDTLGVLWAKNYFEEIAAGILTPYHALIKTADNGYGYFISTDTVFVNSNAVLVKTDKTGATGCEQDLALRVDTLLLDIRSWAVPAVDLADIDTIELKDEQAFTGINPTMEGLELTGGGLACLPLSELLDATVQEAESYSWSTGETTPAITATMPGQFTVLVSSQSLCFSLPDTTSINVLPPPTGTAVADLDSLCEDNQALLFANGILTFSYLWSTGEVTPQIIVSNTGTYTVTLTNPCGSTAISVDVPRTGCICNLVFPNAFTPDNDTHNDRFQPAFPCPNLTEFQLLVYNRWGENVFETRSQTQGWEGQFNGEPAVSDVYAWYATFKTPEGELKTMKGDVTLLR
ncbi:MAG: gliding motility-associated C-terminal domain-containing protein [Saprospirales bacterium]|nr:gliding motility-associated C-terminal domain-containing protein [Saprospirales bacterium]MBK8921600.1 gliding motility-associated C-terminal domain-containing protein [Saprospirales bacterium]